MKEKDIARFTTQLAKAAPAKRRGEMLRVAVDLALHGYPRAAVALFEAAQAHPPAPHESLYYAGAFATLRLALGLEVAPDARRAAAEAEEAARADLLGDPWPDRPLPAHEEGPPPPGLDVDATGGWFRRALHADEPTRLAILRAICDRAETPVYFRRRGGLIVAEALARAGDPGAGAALDAWIATNDSLPERALALPPLARLLAARSGPLAARVDAFVAEASTPPAPAESVETHEVVTLYNQLWLEPRTPDPAAAPYFSDPAEVEAGVSLRGAAVALSTPEECEACAVTVRVGEPPKKLPRSDRVVRFPLRVEDGLYLRGVAETGDASRHAVPPGEYAATAVFVRRKRAGLARYDVTVWLSPTSEEGPRPAARGRSPRR